MEIPPHETAMLFCKMSRIKRELEGYYELYMLTRNPKMKEGSIKCIDRVLNDQVFMTSIYRHSPSLRQVYAGILLNTRHKISETKDIE